MNTKNIVLLVFSLTAIGCTKEPIPSAKDTSPVSVEPSPLPVEKVYDFTHRQVTESSGATSWIFRKEEINYLEPDILPPLNLSTPKEFTKSINDALLLINLPGITESDPAQHRVERIGWVFDNYPPGKLTIWNTICDYLPGEDFDCIWKITLD